MVGDYCVIMPCDLSSPKSGKEITYYSEFITESVVYWGSVEYMCSWNLTFVVV